MKTGFKKDTLEPDSSWCCLSAAGKPAQPTRPRTQAHVYTQTVTCRIAPAPWIHYTPHGALKQKGWGETGHWAGPVSTCLSSPAGHKTHSRSLRTAALEHESHYLGRERCLNHLRQRRVIVLRCWQLLINSHLIAARTTQQPAGGGQGT